MRFEYVRKMLGTKVHVGVRDTQNPTGQPSILHLYDAKSGGVIIHWEHDDGSWKHHPILTQTMDDGTVASLWSQMCSAINRHTIARRDNGTDDGEIWMEAPVPYDPRGDITKHGWSCESFASLILTGKCIPILGEALSKLGLPDSIVKAFTSSSSSSRSR